MTWSVDVAAGHRFRSLLPLVYAIVAVSHSCRLLPSVAVAGSGYCSNSGHCQPSQSLVTGTVDAGHCRQTQRLVIAGAHYL